MKISLILPYFDRQEAANAAFKLLDKHYRGLDLEVIVVDDGSRSPFVPPPTALKVVIVSLPRKETPKSPCVCWNEGAKVATGDIIMLSCVEILHERPVIEQLAQAVIEGGKDAYALAAAWCPEMREWHCHSQHASEGAEPIPAGTGRAFLGAMHRDLYLRVGGWDEEYRDGAGYDDVDFIYRMQRMGAKFIMRDDLVVTHPKTGATTRWPEGAFERNRAIFERKWGWRRRPEITVVCVKAGTAFGPEYVNNLYDAVLRCMPQCKMDFVCITDDEAGLHPDILRFDLPPRLDKWWGKLYMFKRGLFPHGRRMVFFDLDTLIVGKLDDIVAYDGPLATLRDFWRPTGLGPAVILWKAGADLPASIWDEWVAQGEPRNPRGDQGWMEELDQGRFHKEVDILQDLYPRSFYSYKTDCVAAPPATAKVICFHGRPRPHEVTDGWVPGVWKVGGANMLQLEHVANTQQEQTEDNVRACLERGLPSLTIKPPHGGHAVLVGGGPSLARTLDEVRQRAAVGQTIIALNGAAHYLQANGIHVDWQVIVDARPDNAAFVTPPLAVDYFIASQCAPEVFDALAGEEVTVFHANNTPTFEATKALRNLHLIGGGSTVGLLAMSIAHTQGYRCLHLYGYDSSYTADHHAYAQALNDNDQSVIATVNGENFKCAPWMILQVNQFQALATALAEEGSIITVAGDGLLPFVAKQMQISITESLEEAA